MKFNFTFFCLLMCTFLWAQKETPLGPAPTKAQLAWHNMEYYWFIHFGPNTFTGKEWGHGDESVDEFNPTAMDCRQWARLAKKAGAKGIIITAKHHDGFALWPSKYFQHTVKQSKWKNGEGDVLKELANACKEVGIKMGVYLSPWDRNHPQYGTSAYNDVYVNTMKELVENYGPFFEFWWDGANGEGPNGKKQEYDFKRFEATMRSIAPNTILFSDIGPDARWVGNENGIAATTNWNLLDTAGYTRGKGAPDPAVLATGNINGKNWIPAECDVSIRPGWFFHEKENEKVKTPEDLFELYLKSVGRGATFLLNVPPDTRGLIHEKDSAALMGFKALLDKSFANNQARSAKAEMHSNGMIFNRTKFNDGSSDTYEKIGKYQNVGLYLKFNPVKKINTVVLKEAIQFGQRVKSAKIILLNGSSVVETIDITTIGHKRIVTFPTVAVSAVNIVITDAKGDPILSEIETYLIPEKLLLKE